MSFKAVELQIALPKTFEAGKIQEQITQQIHANQDQSNEALKKQLEKNHTLLLESAELKKLKQDDPKEQQNELNEQHAVQTDEQVEKEQQRQQAKHPFKGNFFDFSG